MSSVVTIETADGVVQPFPMDRLSASVLFEGVARDGRVQFSHALKGGYTLVQVAEGDDSDSYVVDNETLLQATGGDMKRLGRGARMNFTWANEEFATANPDNGSVERRQVRRIQAISFFCGKPANN